MVPPRTIHCANAALYGAMSLIVTAAGIYYVFVQHGNPGKYFQSFGVWSYIAAGLAVLAALVWGGYYVTLRYVVDAQGITRKLPGSSIRIEWADLTRAELCETHTESVCNATLHLETADTAMELGSDLLSLDSVQGLAKDLAAADLLTAPLPESCE